MAWTRRLTAVAALITSWALLAAPGVVVHAAVNDHEDRVPGSGGAPWGAAFVMAVFAAYVFRRFVAPPRGGRKFRSMAEGVGVLVVGAYALGFLLATSGPTDPYVSGLIASAVCLLAGSLRRAPAATGRRPRPGRGKPTTGRRPSGGGPPRRRATSGPTRTGRPARVPRPTPGSAPSPGQIWFASVPFDDVSEAKDRPCLVVGTGPRGVNILKITSQDKSGRPEYIRMPVAGWDPSATHDSWLELDRPRRIARSAFRRPLGVCDEGVWRQVTHHHNLR